MCNKFSWYFEVQWKPLIMITLGPALFDNNNLLIMLSGEYKNLHYLTQFIVTTFYMYIKEAGRSWNELRFLAADRQKWKGLIDNLCS